MSKSKPELPDGRWLTVIAGSNGSGKPTFVELYLRSRGFRLVNADLIAAGLSGAGAEARFMKGSIPTR